MYKIGEFIVYGNEGVCEVENISELNIPGTDKIKNYYSLKPMHGNGKVFVPVDTNIFMRPVVTPEEIQDIIKDIPLVDEAKQELNSARALQEHYKKLLNTHECVDTLTVMVSLNNKKANLVKNNKKLGQIEEKFFRIANDLIEDELSIVLGISKEEAETYIQDEIIKMYN